MTLSFAEELLGNWDTAVASLRRMRRPAVLMPTAGRTAQAAVHAAIAVDLARAGHLEAADGAVAELGNWTTAAQRIGYAEEGLVDYAAAMLAYYRGQYEIADTLWTIHPPDSWSSGQPLVHAIYLLDLARVRARVGRTGDARLLLHETVQILQMYISPGRMLEWARTELEHLGGGHDLIAVSPTPTGPPPTAAAADLLSPREVEVLRLLRSEFSAPEIAEHLCVSYNTIKTHQRVIYRKLGANSRSTAVAAASNLGYQI